MTDRPNEPREENLPNAEGLGGESEYSVREAEREEPKRERPRKEPPRREPLNPDADELGRRYLEDATQAPAKPKRKARGPDTEEAVPLADVISEE